MQTDKNGCGWVRMSALGHRGHGKARKQGKQTQKRLCSTYFGGHGRGNFPEHDVFAN